MALSVPGSGPEFIPGREYDWQQVGSTARLSGVAGPEMEKAVKEKLMRELMEAVGKQLTELGEGTILAVQAPQFAVRADVVDPLAGDKMVTARLKVKVVKEADRLPEPAPYFDIAPVAKPSEADRAAAKALGVTDTRQKFLIHPKTLQGDTDEDLSKVRQILADEIAKVAAWEHRARKVKPK